MLPRFHDLGELQLAVLNVLWSHPQATVHDVQAALPTERKPAYTTVLTVLRNLEKRGLVTHTQADGGRRYHYSAVVTADDTARQMLKELLARHFGGSTLGLILHLLETEPLTTRDLQTLVEAILQVEARLDEAAPGQPP